MDVNDAVDRFYSRIMSEVVPMLSVSEPVMEIARNLSAYLAGPSDPEKRDEIHDDCFDMIYYIENERSLNWLPSDFSCTDAMRALTGVYGMSKHGDDTECKLSSFFTNMKNAGNLSGYPVMGLMWSILLEELTGERPYGLSEKVECPQA